MPRATNLLDGKSQGSKISPHLAELGGKKNRIYRIQNKILYLGLKTKPYTTGNIVKSSATTITHFHLLQLSKRQQPEIVVTKKLRQI